MDGVIKFMCDPFEMEMIFPSGDILSCAVARHLLTNLGSPLQHLQPYLEIHKENNNKKKHDRKKHKAIFLMWEEENIDIFECIFYA